MKFTTLIASALLIPLAGAFQVAPAAPKSRSALYGIPADENWQSGLVGKHQENLPATGMGSFPVPNKQEEVPVDEDGNPSVIGAKPRPAWQALAATGDPHRERYDRPNPVPKTTPDQSPEEDWHHLNW